MAKSGIRHVVASVPVTRDQYESEEHHALVSGTSFPTNPVEKQLFYRIDEHRLYIYNGTDWINMTGAGVTVHNELTGRDAADCHPLTAITGAAAHASRHQHGGADEINIAGLDGEPIALTAHKSLATGVHGAGSNYLAYAASQGHVVLPFTKGWTSGRYLRGAGVGNSPTEVLILGDWTSVPKAWEWQLWFGCWSMVVTGSGTTLRDYGVMYVDTGSTANSTARALGYNFGWMPFGTLKIQMYAYFVPRALPSTGHHWYKLDINAHGNPTGAAFGWRVDPGYALKGIVHNGTSLTVVDLNTTLTANDAYHLFLDFVAGQGIYWYVNGVMKGSSTNIPTSQRQENMYPILCAENGNTAQACRCDIWVQGWLKY